MGKRKGRCSKVEVAFKEVLLASTEVEKRGGQKSGEYSSSVRVEKVEENGVTEVENIRVYNSGQENRVKEKSGG